MCPSFLEMLFCLGLLVGLFRQGGGTSMFAREGVVNIACGF